MSLGDGSPGPANCNLIFHEDERECWRNILRLQPSLLRRATIIQVEASFNSRNCLLITCPGYNTPSGCCLLILRGFSFCLFAAFERGKNFDRGILIFQIEFNYRLPYCWILLFWVAFLFPLRRDFFLHGDKLCSARPRFVLPQSAWMTSEGNRFYGIHEGPGADMASSHSGIVLPSADFSHSEFPLFPNFVAHWVSKYGNTLTPHLVTPQLTVLSGSFFSPQEVIFNWANVGE